MSFGIAFNEIERELPGQLEMKFPLTYSKSSSIFQIIIHFDFNHVK